MYQHYVPSIYLRGFTSQPTTPGHEAALWVTDLKEGTERRRAPKNIGGETDFYETVGASNGPGAGIESRLSIIEGRFRSGLAKLTEPHDAYISGDLFWFVATLAARTPWARGAMAAYEARHGVPKSFGGLSDRERWAGTVEYLASWADVYMRRMSWVVCGPHHPEDQFLTTDRPVSLSGSGMDGSLMDLLRLTEPDSIVTIPINSRLALIGSYDQRATLQLGTTTDAINSELVRQAHRYIFSPKRRLSS